VYIWANGDKYLGEFHRGMNYYCCYHDDYYSQYNFQGMMEGSGRMEWQNGDIYIGQWYQGKMTGIGSLIKAEGGKLQGSFVEGRLQGWGKRITLEGWLWQGYFESGNLTGYGTIEDTMMSSTSTSLPTLSPSFSLSSISAEERKPSSITATTTAGRVGRGDQNHIVYYEGGWYNNLQRGSSYQLLHLAEEITCFGNSCDPHIFHSSSFSSRHYHHSHRRLVQIHFPHNNQYFYGEIGRDDDLHQIIELDVLLPSPLLSNSNQSSSTTAKTTTSTDISNRLHALKKEQQQTQQLLQHASGGHWARIEYQYHENIVVFEGDCYGTRWHGDVSCRS
jgi:hypothetical protein